MVIFFLTFLEKLEDFICLEGFLIRTDANLNEFLFATVRKSVNK